MLLMVLPILVVAVVVMAIPQREVCKAFREQAAQAS